MASSASTHNPSTRRRTAHRRKSSNVDVDASSATHQAMSITASLERTKGMMARELERVTTLDSTINDDGALLSNARDEHVGMGGTMRGARGIMRKLGRQDVRDAIILRFSIAFYWCAVAYVLWSRIKVPFLP
ncbi:hypothetical protein ACHAXA_001940 [Cyclostephanos tholiformis]|uniref:Sec20 C-terminal domain-containing protein n=1 Tax=Cyclostephanos tholiformis TaxID=382380 RepID=A0ABD3RUD9_9STRA